MLDGLELGVTVYMKSGRRELTGNGNTLNSVMDTHHQRHRSLTINPVASQNC